MPHGTRVRARRARGNVPVPMLTSILDWLRTHEGPPAYLVLGLAGLIEYVFPPFPGDAIAVFGVCLAFGAGYQPAIVYAALVAGAVVGGQAMWWLGRRYAARDSRPALLRGPRAEAALREVQARFEQHGSLFLVVHRFIPALRAFVFVGAGMSNLYFWRVLLLGGASAMAWNAVLMGAGWLVSANWERLAGIVSAYSTVVILLVVVGAIVALVVRARRTGAS